MIADSHMHSSFSSDSEAPAEEMILRALELGMASMCLTDHYDKDYISDGFVLDTAAYLETLADLREKYRGRIEVRIGAELGLQLHLKEWLEAYVRENPFDFVIGSMHMVGGVDPYYPETVAGMDEKELIRTYFRETAENLDSCHSFQALGHLDYLVRYLPKAAGEYSYDAYADEIDAVLKRLIEYGIALELNTAGLRYPMGRTNPGIDVFRRYRELGGELVTVGADAHKPGDVGSGFGQAEELLRACGFRYYTLFRQKKPFFEKL